MSESKITPLYVSEGGVYEFTPKMLEGHPDNTYFILQPIKKGEVGNIRKIVSITKGTQGRSEINLFKQQFEACKRGIVGVKNLYDQDRNLIEDWNVEMLEGLDNKLIGQIGNQLLGTTDLGEEEAENLD